MKTLHIKTSKLCERLFKLERQGRYEDALSEIGDVWLDKTGLPDTEGLEPHLAAELILRCGSLFGFLGHNKQIPNSQEKSRNLLTTARSTFTENYNIEKIAECENYLALTYSRKGELDEAKIWLDEAFSHNLPLSNHTRIYTYILKGLVLLSALQHRDILNTLLPVEATIKNCTDYCLKGAFYNQVGNAWENLGNIPNALHSLELAKDFYQKARNQVYFGAVLNDLAFLYKTNKDYDKAHQMSNAAINTFKKIKDRSHEGFSIDTKARIYHLEGKFADALETIEKAVSILKIGENAAYLVETYGTKIQILIAMDEVSTATFCLLDAVQIAKTRISEEAAKNLVKDYENCLREQLAGAKNSSSEIKKPEKTDVTEKIQTEKNSVDDIELILPPLLANFTNIRAIWINNTNLEKFGLVKNSLAIFVPNAEIKRGDLVAIEEIKTRDASCGFYENEFGIVCLEGQEGEPQIFDEEEIRILGKIVGVAVERTKDGKLIVEPISL